MQEVLPGIWDWEAYYAKLGMPVHSHAVHGTLIDPILPEDGLEAVRRLEPERIVLSNRHHDRHADRVAEELGLPVLCHRDGLHEFREKPLDPDGYEDGDEVAPGIVAYEVVEGWYGECALHVPDAELLIIADTVIRDQNEDLAFVPDMYLGDDPEEEKAELRAGLRGLLDLEFDHMLFAHGPPWIGGAKAALREFVGV
jgi:hypothetical protein